MKLLDGHDVIQTTTYYFFHNRIDKYLFPKILNNKSKHVLFNASCTLPYNKFVKDLAYSPCQQCKKYDLPNHTCDLEKKGVRNFEYKRYEKFDAIVSSHYEYFKAFENTGFKQKNKFIPIPIRQNEIYYPLTKIPGKINVYYGETRFGFKGGHFIKEAIERIKNSSYAKYFNFTYTKRISYNEYTRILDNTHVLIDQCNSYSYGVNALVGLTKGKIVMTGAEPEIFNFMGIDQNECPLINIRPSVDDIFIKLISLVSLRQHFPEMSVKGMEFVKKYHNPIKIAHEYEKLYQSI